MTTMMPPSLLLALGLMAGVAFRQPRLVPVRVKRRLRGRRLD